MQRPKGKIRFWIGLGALVFLSAGVLLLADAFRDAIVFYFTPTEFYQKGAPTCRISVGGYVVKGSLMHEADGWIVFTLKDAESTINVRFRGAIPTLFQEGQGAVAEGKYDPIAHVFQAQKLLAKHDENYRPPKLKERP